MRILGLLCLALASIILIGNVSTYYRGRRETVPARRTIGAEIGMCLLVAAGVTVLRDAAQRDGLILSARTSKLQAAESHDLLRTTLTSIADAVISTDAEGMITFLNPAAKQLSGWPGDQALGQRLDKVFAITNEFTGAVVENPLNKVLRKERAVGLASDTVLTSRDGRVIPIGDSSAPVRDTEGNIVGVVVVFRDLTVAKRALEAHISLAAIVESSEDAIIGERLDGTITSWNAAATRIFGYSAEEMIGSSITLLTPVNHADDSLDLLELIKRDERVRHFETSRRRKDGSDIAVDIALSPIRNAAGAIVGASKVLRDVTDRQRIQGQLLHGQKLECLGVLAGGVAHDFNNYLMAIAANAALIADEVPAESPVANLAGNILIATDQSARLTRQMLDYSGKGRFVVQRLYLNKHIQEMASLFRASIAKDVELRLNLAADLPAINADAGQILQLLTNLVLNGAEATRPGGAITISTSLQKVNGRDYKNLAGDPVPSGHYGMLEVRDTGSGMDEATQSRMFDPFFTTKFTGRGLGLAAVLGIVRGHKGEISVLSQPGEGTAFQVFFPVERGSLGLSNEPAERALHGKM